MSKIDKAVVLYFPAKVLGAKKGACCAGCMMYVPENADSGHCTVVIGSISGPKGVCGLYVFGKHSGPDMRGTMPQDVAGYIEGGKDGEAPTHCGNCEYYMDRSKDSSPCEKVEGMVEYYGCCNAWEPFDGKNRNIRSPRGFPPLPKK